MAALFSPDQTHAITPQRLEWARHSWFQNHGADCFICGESPLSAAAARCLDDGKSEGIHRGGGARRALRTRDAERTDAVGVFVVNFLALGLVWTYVMRSYPTLVAARYWASAAFTAAFFAAVSMLRGVFDSMLPLLFGGGGLIFAICLSHDGDSTLL